MPKNKEASPEDSMDVFLLVAKYDVKFFITHVVHIPSPEFGLKGYLRGGRSDGGPSKKKHLQQ
jgi:hypothetical protein